MTTSAHTYYSFIQPLLHDIDDLYISVILFSDNKQPEIKTKVQSILSVKIINKTPKDITQNNL